MRANRASAITRLKIQMARQFPGALALLTQDAIKILEQSGISALDVRTLRRLVPDLDLREIFGDATRLGMADVRQVLNATRVEHLDSELLQQAAREAAEAAFEDEPEDREDDQLKQDQQPDTEVVSQTVEVVEAQAPEAEPEPVAAAEVAIPEVVSEAETEPEVEVVEVVAEELERGIPVYRLDKTPSQALVIHCGDPRFQQAFRRFITEELGIPNYTPVIIGGGLHAFGAQSLRPKNLKVLWQQIKFFVRQGGLTQVIFINHEDCQWYAKMKGYRSALELPVLGRVDLQTAATQIAEDFTGVDVRSFFAALDGDQIVFEEM
jgi:hypothetical protein